jgi:Putative peptidoglycan binding domain
LAYLKVEANETLAQVVKRSGTNWSVAAIQAHERNKLLLENRSPNALKTGDAVWIPDEPAARKLFALNAGSRGTFVLRGQTRPFSLRLHYPNGEPIASKPFRLSLGALTLEGTTDAEGMLTTQVPLDATEGVVVADKHSRKVVIGGLEPIHMARGIQARLLNLGYAPGPIDGVLGDRTIAAIKAFQEQEGLEVDGIVGDETRAALKAAYGS